MAPTSLASATSPNRSASTTASASGKPSSKPPGGQSCATQSVSQSVGQLSVSLTICATKNIHIEHRENFRQAGIKATRRTVLCSPVCQSSSVSQSDNKCHRRSPHRRPQALPAGRHQSHRADNPEQSCQSVGRLSVSLTTCVINAQLECTTASASVLCPLSGN